MLIPETGKTYYMRRAQDLAPELWRVLSLGDDGFHAESLDIFGRSKSQKELAFVIYRDIKDSTEYVWGAP